MYSLKYLLLLFTIQRVLVMRYDLNHAKLSTILMSPLITNIKGVFGLAYFAGLWAYLKLEELTFVFFT